MFVAFLDAKSAFDVVSHSSLLRKLFHLGIGVAEWSLVHSLHEGAESVVKWEDYPNPVGIKCEKSRHQRKDAKRAEKMRKETCFYERKTDSAISCI